MRTSEAPGLFLRACALAVAAATLVIWTGAEMIGLSRPPAPPVPLHAAAEARPMRHVHAGPPFIGELEAGCGGVVARAPLPPTSA